MTNNDDSHGDVVWCEKSQQTELSLLVNYFPLSEISLMHIDFNVAHNNRINGGIE